MNTILSFLGTFSLIKWSENVPFEKHLQSAKEQIVAW